MKVLIDADACPVVSIAAQLCEKFQIPCILLCDTAHIISRPNAKTEIFDKGADSVDFAIANRVAPGDLVITQDYGLASVCLARNTRVLHQDGWEYTPWNIDALLLQRHESRKFRAAGGRTKGPKKRTAQQDMSFNDAMTNLLQTMSQG